MRWLLVNKFKNYFDTKFLFHVLLLNLINKKIKKNKTGYKVKQISRSADNLIYQLNNLKDYISRLKHKTQKTVWTDYSIDNFYEDIEGIQDLFKNMSVENWKGSKWSRNFKDYYDCRPIFANNYPEYDKMEARRNGL